MPETRYIETYEQGTGKMLKKESYVISDEELAKESEKQRMANILAEIDALRARIEKLEKK